MILTDHTGTYTINYTLHFRNSRPETMPQGCVYLMVVTRRQLWRFLMRPGPQRSFKINDMHAALGHTHDANAAETSRQRPIKVTGYRNYCGHCGESKAMKCTVLKTGLVVTEMPAKRLYFDINGPFPAIAGRARYCLLVVDCKTNVRRNLVHDG